MKLELFFSYSLRSNLELELKNSYKTVTVVTTVTAVTIFREPNNPSESLPLPTLIS